MKKMFKNKKGFTLIEIMVVMAILGVLVAVAVPAFNETTLDAHQRVCDANIRTIRSAIVAASTVDVIVSKGIEVNSDCELEPFIYDIDSMVCPSCNKHYKIDEKGNILCAKHSEKSQFRPAT